eukprot:TRINITY_DN7450_c0_g1_i1.p8 TRINITY_DN7450_c0_g1~~TRINITY_DN7450_c0_g1_i1.p8  ORF type:complete len:142 (+),score=44.04 TRINITY_DN7450_c0_g1_i1:2661-3086(+)
MLRTNVLRVAVRKHRAAAVMVHLHVCHSDLRLAEAAWAATHRATDITVLQTREQQQVQDAALAPPFEPLQRVDDLLLADGRCRGQVAPRAIQEAVLADDFGWGRTGGVEAAAEAAKARAKRSPVMDALLGDAAFFVEARSL